MKTKIEQNKLFPNQDIYTDAPETPAVLKTALTKVNQEKLGKTQEDQQTSLAIISNWVDTLWNGMIFITNSQQLESTAKQTFYQDFEEKLAEFIAHPDHGITHSFFVYKGMLHLSTLEGKAVTPHSSEDKQIQLMALLHDAMQALPFAITKNQNRPSHINQKNEHAKIIGALTRMFGQKLGFDKKTIKEVAYGLRLHDESYQRTIKPGEFNYISQLLHDSDKIFGTSLETDINVITAGMLKRNLIANNGAKGSYLIRTDLDKIYRDKIVYGDRCFSDAISLIIRELKIQMCTHSGKDIARQRREVAMQQITEVYGYYFDKTKNIIDTIIIPNLLASGPTIALSEIGMDQIETDITSSIANRESLTKKISQLYTRPLLLNPANHRKGYNPDTDARGWKIHVVHTPTNTNEYLDPSIARFCMMNDGKTEFLNELKTAFNRHLVN